MKATELRLGNWVRIKTTQHESNVTALRADKVWLVDNPHLDDCGWHEGLEPIPLTEKWLEKFGFKLERKADYVHVDMSEYVLGIFMVDDGNNFHLNYDYYDSPCDYVHQLQNLYFALTGSELEIK